MTASNEMTPDEFEELSGAYALDAVEPSEAAAMEAFMRADPGAAVDIERLRAAAGWYGASEAVSPPPSLRAALLRHVGSRTKSSPGGRTHIEAANYLRAVLRNVDDHDLGNVTANGLTVRDLVAHLAAMESVVAEAAGVPTMPEISEQDVDERTALVLRATRDEDFATIVDRWNDAVVAARTADADGATLLISGDAQPTSSVLTFRAFETWIHAGDIAEVTGDSRSMLSSESMHAMAELSMGLMPAALELSGTAVSHRCAQIVLSGEGGGSWTIALAPDEVAAGEPVFVLEAPIREWCLRVGDRVAVAEFPMQVEGDAILARQLITAANSFATL